MTHAPGNGVRLQPNGAGVLMLDGAISYDNAAAVFRAAPRELAAGKAVDLDLAALRDADSATMAVLIGWAAHARASGGSLRYLNAPPALRKLAHLSDVDTLLGF
jgi:ABC-type transporter Mla MlaB component